MNGGGRTETPGPLKAAVVVLLACIHCLNAVIRGIRYAIVVIVNRELIAGIPNAVSIRIFLTYVE